MKTIMEPSHSEEVEHDHDIPVQPRPHEACAKTKPQDSSEDTTKLSPKFNYKTLDMSRRSIRLLQLVRPDSTLCIRGSLQEFGLEEAPPYDALSYTWGTMNDFSHDIDCNESVMKVGKNLFDFLDQYQHVVEPDSWIWIDAICIDQSSIEERNHQVSQMMEIFSGAKLVHVWLGKGEDSGRATPAVTTIRVETLDLEDLKTKARLDAILPAKYWTRAWVVQEYAVARNIKIWLGDLTVDRNFVDFLLTSEKYQGEEWRAAYYINVMRSAWHLTLKMPLSSRRLTFADLLIQGQPLESSLPLDRVYAIMGLALDLHDRPGKIKVDYSHTPIDLLFEILKNVCWWNERMDREENMLIITRMAFIFDLRNVEVLLEKAVDVASRIMDEFDDELVLRVTLYAWFGFDGVACEERREPTMEALISEITSKEPIYDDSAK